MADVDPLEYLANKKREVAAMQEAANIAQEQALVMLRLQRRVADIDALAQGGAALSPSSRIGALDAEPSYFDGGASLGSPGRPSTYPPQQNGAGAQFGYPVCRVATPPPTFSQNSPIRIRAPGAPSPASSIGASPLRTVAVAQSSMMTATPTHSVQANGRGGSSQAVSCLSPEDRRRFGLDDGCADGPGRPAAVAAGGNQRQLFAYSSSPVVAAGGSPTRLTSSAPQRPEALRPSAAKTPPWSSLTEEDRRRFGLLASDDGGPVVGSGPPPSRAAVSTPIAFEPDRELLWGRNGGAAAGLNGNTAPSMALTIQQLEASGALQCVADLKESERQLQSLRLRG